MAVIGSVGIIFEVTRDNDGHSSKMKHFYETCQEFVSSTLTLPKKIKLFTGIPNSKRREFHAIKDWRFVYVSDMPELITKNLNEKTLGNRSNFHILNKYHIHYLKFLANNLGEFGKYELLQKLNISSDDAQLSKGKDKFNAVEIISRRISSKIPDVDLYAFRSSVLDLLRMTRVDRYGSLSNWIPETGTNSYQRLFHKDKFSELHEFIHKNKGASTFPNTITVVINGDSNFKNNQLELAKQYGSLDIIDGQHRLFAFAKSGLNTKELDKAELLVTGIKFNDTNKSKINQWSARTFVEINSKQRSVPNDLIYLLKYGVMHENQPKDLATEALKRLNTSTRSYLYSLFKTNPFPEKSLKKIRQIKIVTIANVIAPLFSKKNPNPTKSESEKLLNEQIKEINIFFSDVKDIFKEDWEKNPKDSLIFTTNYFSGICEILVRSKKQKLTRQKTKIKLQKLKNNINSTLKKYNVNSNSFNDMIGPNGEIFWKENQHLPRPSNQSAIKSYILKNAGFRNVK